MADITPGNINAAENNKKIDFKVGETTQPKTKKVVKAKIPSFANAPVGDYKFAQQSSISIATKNRHDTVLRSGTDPDEIRAQQQSGYAKYTNSFGQLFTNFVGETTKSFGYVAGGLTGLVREGLIYAATGNEFNSAAAIETMDKNFIVNGGDWWKNTFNNIMPIYHTNAYNESTDATDRMFSEGSEGLSNGASFMASAFVPGMGFSKVLKIGARVTKYLNRSAKLAKLGKVSEAAKLIEKAKILNSNAAKLTASEIASATGGRALAIAKNQQKIASAIDFLSLHAYNVVSEAGHEAAGVRERMFDKHLWDMDEHGNLVGDEDILKFQNDAWQKTFSYNVALLSLTNLPDAVGVFKTFGGAKLSIAKARKLAAKSTGKFAKARYIGKGFTVGAVTEGILEEGGQAAIEKYATDEVINSSNISDVAPVLFKNLIKGFADVHTREAMLIGAMMGSIPGGLHQLRNQLEAKKQGQYAVFQKVMREAYTDDFANDFLKTDKDGNLIKENGKAVLDTETLSAKVKEIQENDAFEAALLQTAVDMDSKTLYNSVLDRRFEGLVGKAILEGADLQAINEDIEYYAESQANVIEALEPGIEKRELKKEIEDTKQHYRERAKQMVSTFKNASGLAYSAYAHGLIEKDEIQQYAQEIYMLEMQAVSAVDAFQSFGLETAQFEDANRLKKSREYNRLAGELVYNNNQLAEVEDNVDELKKELNDTKTKLKENPTEAERTALLQKKSEIEEVLKEGTSQLEKMLKKNDELQKKVTKERKKLGNKKDTDLELRDDKGKKLTGDKLEQYSSRVGFLADLKTASEQAIEMRQVFSDPTKLKELVDNRKAKVDERKKKFEEQAASDDFIAFKARLEDVKDPKDLAIFERKANEKGGAYLKAFNEKAAELKYDEYKKNNPTPPKDNPKLRQKQETTERIKEIKERIKQINIDFKDTDELTKSILKREKSQLGFELKRLENELKDNSGKQGVINKAISKTKEAFLKGYTKQYNRDSLAFSYNATRLLSNFEEDVKKMGKDGKVLTNDVKASATDLLVYKLMSVLNNKSEITKEALENNIKAQPLTTYYEDVFETIPQEIKDAFDILAKEVLTDFKKLFDSILKQTFQDKANEEVEEEQNVITGGFLATLIPSLHLLEGNVVDSKTLKVINAIKNAEVGSKVVLKRGKFNKKPTVDIYINDTKVGNVHEDSYFAKEINNYQKVKENATNLNDALLDLRNAFLVIDNEVSTKEAKNEANATIAEYAKKFGISKKDTLTIGKRSTNKDSNGNLSTHPEQFFNTWLNRMQQERRVANEMWDATSKSEVAYEVEAVSTGGFVQGGPLKASDVINDITNKDIVYFDESGEMINARTETAYKNERVNTTRNKKADGLLYVIVDDTLNGKPIPVAIFPSSLTKEDKKALLDAILVLGESSKDVTTKSELPEQIEALKTIGKIIQERSGKPSLDEEGNERPRNQFASNVTNVMELDENGKVIPLDEGGSIVGFQLNLAVPNRDVTIHFKDGITTISERTSTTKKGAEAFTNTTSNDSNFQEVLFEMLDAMQFNHSFADIVTKGKDAEEKQKAEDYLKHILENRSEVRFQPLVDKNGKTVSVTQPKGKGVSTNMNFRFVIGSPIKTKPKPNSKQDGLNSKQLAMEELSDRIAKFSKSVKKTKDERYYIINGKRYTRVTSYFKPSFKQTPIVKLANQLGTVFDEIGRDVMAGTVKSPKDYYIKAGKPLAYEKTLQKYIDDLIAFKNNLKKKGEIPFGSEISNTPGAKYILHNEELGLAGEVDLMTYDKDGNVHIYDLKTIKEYTPDFKWKYENKDVEKHGSIKGKDKYTTGYNGEMSYEESHASQLSIYGTLLYGTYGVKPVSYSIIPTSINYTSNATGVSDVKLYPEIKHKYKVVKKGEQGISKKHYDSLNETEKELIKEQEKEYANIPLQPVADEVNIDNVTYTPTANEPEITSEEQSKNRIPLKGDYKTDMKKLSVADYNNRKGDSKTSMGPVLLRTIKKLTGRANKSIHFAINERAAKLLEPIKTSYGEINEIYLKINNGGFAVTISDTKYKYLFKSNEWVLHNDKGISIEDEDVSNKIKNDTKSKELMKDIESIDDLIVTNKVFDTNEEKIDVLRKKYNLSFTYSQFMELYFNDLVKDNIMTEEEMKGYKEGDIISLSEIQYSESNPSLLEIISKEVEDGANIKVVKVIKQATKYKPAKLQVALVNDINLTSNVYEVEAGASKNVDISETTDFGDSGSKSVWTEQATKHSSKKAPVFAAISGKLDEEGKVKSPITRGLFAASYYLDFILSTKDKQGKENNILYQRVQAADSVYAVGRIIQTSKRLKDGQTTTITRVEGKPGVAVAMALSMSRKPVYVFNTVDNAWYTYSPKQKTFIKIIKSPVLSKNYLAAGSIKYTTDAAKKAIEKLYSDTAKRGAIDKPRGGDFGFNNKKVAPSASPTGGQKASSGKKAETTPTSINVYFGKDGSSLFAGLSNFATRPFKSPIDGNTYQNVEAAFQAAKADYLKHVPGETLEQFEQRIADVAKEFVNLTGKEARAKGKDKNFMNIDSKDWDNDSEKIMKILLKASFKQNPEALSLLLSTGNATLTHTQDKSKWGEAFPRLLMEVRDYFNEQIPAEQTTTTESELTTHSKPQPPVSETQTEKNEASIDTEVDKDFDPFDFDGDSRTSAVDKLEIFDTATVKESLSVKDLTEQELELVTNVINAVSNYPNSEKIINILKSDKLRSLLNIINNIDTVNNLDINSEELYDTALALFIQDIASQGKFKNSNSTEFTATLLAKVIKHKDNRNSDEFNIAKMANEAMDILYDVEQEFDNRIKLAKLLEDVEETPLTKEEEYAESFNSNSRFLSKTTILNNLRKLVKYLVEQAKNFKAKIQHLLKGGYKHLFEKKDTEINIMIKPLALKDGNEALIRKFILQNGGSIVVSKTVKLSRDKIASHYNDASNESYFGDVVDYYNGKTAVVMKVKINGNNLSELKKLLSNSNNFKQETSALREHLTGESWQDLMNNAYLLDNGVHVSNSAEEGIRENEIWFDDKELNYSPKWYNFGFRKQSSNVVFAQTILNRINDKYEFYMPNNETNVTSIKGKEYKVTSQLNNTIILDTLNEEFVSDIFNDLSKNGSTVRVDKTHLDKGLIRFKVRDIDDNIYTIDVRTKENIVKSTPIGEGKAVLGDAVYNATLKVFNISKGGYGVLFDSLRNNLKHNKKAIELLNKAEINYYNGNITPDVKFFAMIGGFETTDRLNVETATKWLNENMPTANVSITESLIKTVDGTLAYGLTKAASVYLSKLATFGTEFHEGFHHVMDNIIPSKLSNESLTEIKNLYGIESNDQAHEILADLYRSYQITQFAPMDLPDSVRELLPFMQEVLTIVEDSNVLSNLFDSVSQASTSSTAITESVAKERYSNLHKGLYNTFIDGLTFEEHKGAVKAIVGLFINNIQKTTNERNDDGSMKRLLDVSNRERVKRFTRDGKSWSEFSVEEQNLMEARGDTVFYDNDITEFVIADLVAMQRDYYEEYSTLDKDSKRAKELKRFMYKLSILRNQIREYQTNPESNTIMNKVVNELRKSYGYTYIPLADLLNAQELDGAEKSGYNDSGTTAAKLFNDNGINDDPDTTFRPIVKQKIATLIKQEYKFDDNGKATSHHNVKNTITGQDEFVDFESFFPNFVDKMIGVTSYQNMIDRLNEHSTYIPELKQLITALETDTNLRNAMFVDLNKYLVTETFININKDYSVENRNKSGAFRFANSWAEALKNDSKDVDVIKNIVTRYHTQMKAVTKASYDYTLKPIELINEYIKLFDIIGIKLTEEELYNYIFDEHNSVENVVSGKPIIDYVNLDAIHKTNDALSLLQKPLRKVIAVLEKSSKGKGIVKFNNYGDLNKIGAIKHKYGKEAIKLTYLDVNSNQKNQVNKISYMGKILNLLKSGNEDEILRYLTVMTLDESMNYSTLLVTQVNNTGKVIKEGFLNVVTTPEGEQKYVLNRKFIREFQMSAVGGLRNNKTSEGQVYKEGDTSNWLVQKLAYFFNGNPENNTLVTLPSIIPGDASNTNTFTTSKIFVKGLNKVDGQFTIENDNDLSYVFLNLFRQEAQRMDDAKNLLFKEGKGGRLEYRDDVPEGWYENTNFIKDYHYIIKYENGVPKRVFLEDGVPTGNVFKFQNFTTFNELIDPRLGYLNLSVPAYTEKASSLVAYINKTIMGELTEDFNNVAPKYKEILDTSTIYSVKDKSKVDRALFEMILNQRVFNIEFQNMWSGVTSEFASGEVSKGRYNVSKKGLSQVIVRFKSMFQAGTSGRLFGKDGNEIKARKNVKVAVIHDILRNSNSYALQMRYVEKALEEQGYKVNTPEYNQRKKLLLKGLTKINVADGQGYMSLNRWAEIQISQGRWEEFSYLFNEPVLTSEGVYNYTLKDNLKPEDLMKVLNVVKPVYSSRNPNVVRVNDETHVIMKQEYIKYASFPLIEQFTDGNPELTRLREYMDRNGVDEVIFESAEKQGATNITHVTDADGRLLNDDVLDTIETKTTKFDDYRIQLELTAHGQDAYNKLGVQIGKSIIANLFKEELYNNGDTGNQLIEKHFNSLLNIANSDFNELITKLGLSTFGSELTIESIESIRDLLLTEFDRTGLSEDVKSLFVTEDNKFVNSLDVTDVRGKIMSIINAQFTKNVKDTKFPGSHLTLVSDAFVRADSMLSYDVFVKNLENFGISDYSGEELKIRVDNKGRLIADVLMPPFTKDFINEDGSYIELDKIHPDLLRILGYRIPNTGKHSNVVLNIVGFTPQEAGDIIITPSDFVGKTGWDFDVDSVYLMNRNHTKSKKGSQYLFEPLIENTHKDYVKNRKEEVESVTRNTSEFREMVAAKQRLSNIRKNLNLEYKNAKGRDKTNVGSIIGVNRLITKATKMLNDTKSETYITESEVTELLNDLEKRKDATLAKLDKYVIPEELKSDVYNLIDTLFETAEIEVLINEQYSNYQFNGVEPNIEDLNNEITYINSGTESLVKRIKSQIDDYVYSDTKSNDLSSLLIAEQLEMDNVIDASDNYEMMLERQGLIQAPDDSNNRSKRAAQNDLFDVWETIMTSDLSLVEQLMPSDFSTNVQVRDLIAKINSRNDKVSKNPTSVTYQDDIFSKAVMDKTNLAVFANYGSMMNIHQQVDSRLPGGIYFDVTLNSLKLNKDASFELNPSLLPIKPKSSINIQGKKVLLTEKNIEILKTMSKKKPIIIKIDDETKRKIAQELLDNYTVDNKKLNVRITKVQDLLNLASDENAIIQIYADRLGKSRNGFNNIVGDSISQMIGEDTDNAADAIKDNLISGINDYTKDVYSLIKAVGGTTLYSALLINQPIIQAIYNKIEQANRLDIENVSTGSIVRELKLETAYILLSLDRKTITDYMNNLDLKIEPQKELHGDIKSLLAKYDSQKKYIDSKIKQYTAKIAEFEEMSYNTSKQEAVLRNRIEGLKKQYSKATSKFSNAQLSLIEKIYKVSDAKTEEFYIQAIENAKDVSTNEKMVRSAREQLSALGDFMYISSQAKTVVKYNGILNVDKKDIGNSSNRTMKSFYTIQEMIQDSIDIHNGANKTQIEVPNNSNVQGENRMALNLAAAIFPNIRQLVFAKHLRNLLKDTPQDMLSKVLTERGIDSATIQDDIKLQAQSGQISNQLMDVLEEVNKRLPAYQQEIINYVNLLEKQYPRDSIYPTLEYKFEQGNLYAYQLMEKLMVTENFALRSTTVDRLLGDHPYESSEKLEREQKRLTDYLISMFSGLEAKELARNSLIRIRDGKALTITRSEAVRDVYSRITSYRKGKDLLHPHNFLGYIDLVEQKDANNETIYLLAFKAPNDTTLIDHIKSATDKIFDSNNTVERELLMDILGIAFDKNGFGFDYQKLSTLATSHIKEELGIFESVNTTKRLIDDNSEFAYRLGNVLYADFERKSTPNDFYAPRVYPSKKMDGDPNTDEPGILETVVIDGKSYLYVSIKNIMYNKEFQKNYFKRMVNSYTPASKDALQPYELYQAIDKGHPIYSKFELADGKFYQVIDSKEVANHSKFYMSTFDKTEDMTDLYNMVKDSSGMDMYAKDLYLNINNNMTLPMSIEVIAQNYPDSEFLTIEKYLNNCK